MPKIVPSIRPDNTKPVDFNWLGQYIRYKRTSLGIGVVEAAIMCGLSKTAYSNVELGKNSRVETLFNVLANFGVSLNVQSNDNVKWV